MTPRQEPSGARRGVHLRVSGRVQGVGFRWFVRELAEDLGVRGFVKNLPTGEVEIWAEGDSAVLEPFVAGVRRGPRHALVRQVATRSVEPTGEYAGFDVRA